MAPFFLTSKNPTSYNPSGSMYLFADASKIKYAVFFPENIESVCA